MKNHLNPFLVMCILIACFSSCSQQKIVAQQVETEIKEVSIPKDKTLAETAKEFITRSDKLTDAQKKQLLELQEKTYVQNTSLKEELDKAKIVLMQKVLEPEINNTEYSLLKKKIMSLEKKRMDNNFQAISEVRNIIAPHKNIDNREIYKYYLNHHFQEYLY